MGAQRVPPAPQHRGQCGAPWGAPPSPSTPIPGDTSDPHPTSQLPWGPSPRGAAPPPQPRGGGGEARQGVDLGRWGGSPWRQSAMTTVAMARLRGPARCHGDAPGTASRHGDGRGMERSPWLGHRGCHGMGEKGASRGLSPPTLHAGASPVPPPARCRLVPGAAAAARDHFHEAFPLQFTLPSDRPNFSFSE